MIACKYGHLTLVRALVEWQANICAKNKVIRNRHGSNLLYYHRVGRLYK